MELGDIKQTNINLPIGGSVSVGPTGVGLGGGTVTLPGDNGTATIGPDGTATITLPNNTTITVGSNGSITVPGGSVLTQGSGATASVSGGVNVNAGTGSGWGSITFPDGTVVHVSASGTASIALPNGTRLSISTDGKLNLSLPPGTNPAIAAAVDTANQIIQNGPDVVWSLRKVVDVANGVLGGPVISLPNTGVLGALDLGVTDGGEFRLGVKPPGADDTHITWFDLNIESRIEFQAQDGKLNDGFDPPLEEWQDEGQRSVWHTSVAKLAPNNSNQVVKIVFPSAHVAQQYELFVPTEFAAHVDVTPKEFTAAETPLTITGKNGSTDSVAAEIYLRNKGETAVYGKLIVDVMPWRVVSISSYRIVNSSAPVNASIPAGLVLVNELDARFRPACVSFAYQGNNLSVQQQTINYDLDADGKLLVIGGSGPSTVETNVIKAAMPGFAGKINVLFIADMSPSTFLGLVIRQDPLLAKMAFIAANRWVNPTFSYATSEDSFGASKTLPRSAAHEVGHTLQLSTRAINSGLSGGHDDGVTPETTAPLMRGGQHGPSGRWIRFEDWRAVNDSAVNFAP